MSLWLDELCTAMLYRVYRFQHAVICLTVKNNLNVAMNNLNVFIKEILIF